MSSRILPKLGALKFIFLIVSMVACLMQAAPMTRAQCPTAAWLPGMGVPGTNDYVFAITTWDPDGAGPLAPIWVVGGAFRSVGDLAANYIATYDPVTGQWSTLGSGMNNWVMSLMTLANGDLIAGGYFTTAGGVAAKRIARWNGATWSAMGAGIGETPEAAVLALATLPNGQLIAGGFFHRAGGVSVANIARWNGTTWSAMGNGLGTAGNYYSSVHALLVLANGDVVAGGAFQSSYLTYMPNIARWNGTTWAGFGPDPEWIGAINSLAQLPNGEIVAGPAAYIGTSDQPQVLRWNGTSWSPLGTMEFDGVNALVFLPTGELIAGGGSGVFSWNGATWSSLATESGSNLTIEALQALPGGGLLAGGSFSTIGGVEAYEIAHHDGTQWSPLAEGTNGWSVNTVTELPDGDIAVGGYFTTFGNIAANRIVKGDGSTWTPLGTGLSGPQNTVYVLALAALPNGDLIAAGQFTNVGGTSANRIARWNGATWAPLGSGMPNTVRTVIALPDGHVIAGGDFNTAGGVPCSRIARWDGANWSALGSGLNGNVHALAVLPNGHLVAGGNFTTSGGVQTSYIAQWDGTSWSPIGNGSNGTVYALATQTDGRLIASGSFAVAGGGPNSGLARFDGTTWTSLGFPFSVQAIAALPNGNLVAGGQFRVANGAPADGLAIRIGSTWSAVGSGLNYNISQNPWVNALASRSNGELLVGGRFTLAGGLPNALFARYRVGGWPSISQNPTDTTACALGSATFSVSATGPSPLTYQWQMLDSNSPYVWINIADGPITNAGQAIGIAGGTTTPTLTIIAAIDSGNEIEARFRCLVSNACASPASNVAALHVVPWGTGDGDANGFLDGRDISSFVNILTMGGGPGAGHCAVDMDFSGTLDSADVPLFIAALLAGS